MYIQTHPLKFLILELFILFSDTKNLYSQNYKDNFLFSKQYKKIVSNNNTTQRLKLLTKKIQEFFCGSFVFRTYPTKNVQANQFVPESPIITHFRWLYNYLSDRQFSSVVSVPFSVRELVFQQLTGLYFRRWRILATRRPVFSCWR